MMISEELRMGEGRRQLAAARAPPHPTIAAAANCSYSPCSSSDTNNAFLREADAFKTHLENLGILSRSSCCDASQLQAIPISNLQQHHFTAAAPTSSRVDADHYCRLSSLAASYASTPTTTSSSTDGTLTFDVGAAAAAAAAILLDEPRDVVGHDEFTAAAGNLEYGMTASSSYDYHAAIAVDYQSLDLDYFTYNSSEEDFPSASFVMDDELPLHDTVDLPGPDRDMVGRWADAALAARALLHNHNQSDGDFEQRVVNRDWINTRSKRDDGSSCYGETTHSSSSFLTSATQDRIQGRDMMLTHMRRVTGLLQPGLQEVEATEFEVANTKDQQSPGVEVVAILDLQRLQLQEGAFVVQQIENSKEFEANLLQGLSDTRSAAGTFGRSRSMVSFSPAVRDANEGGGGSGGSSNGLPSRDVDLHPRLSPPYIYDINISSTDKPRSLSQKYRPKRLGELVGQQQGMAARVLWNALDKSKVAAGYVLQGPRGTGKTSAARIFAAALVCAGGRRDSGVGRRPAPDPCGACQECRSVLVGGQCQRVTQIDAASNNGFHRVKAALVRRERNYSRRRGYDDQPYLADAGYEVFMVDECHFLKSETWSVLLNLLEEPPPTLVFLLITTQPDRVPATVLSRCHRFHFPRITNADIVQRLRQLATMENLQVDSDTLRYIASVSDGSLRDAETTLDQLSLLAGVDCHIHACTVQELLVGSASDERVLQLLDCALRADSASTVRRVRELLDSGVEPLSLTSQLASTIADILAGTFDFTHKQLSSGSFFVEFQQLLQLQEGSFRDEKLECLRMAMKTLSDAEKQLRASNDQSTWLMAALLHLAPSTSVMFSRHKLQQQQSFSMVTLDDDSRVSNAGAQTSEEEAAAATDFDGTSDINTSCNPQVLQQNSRRPQTESLDRVDDDDSRDSSGRKDVKSQPCPVTQPLQSQLDVHPRHARIYGDVDISDATQLDHIWCEVLQQCRPLTLRQLLHSHGELVSITVSNGEEGEAAAAVVQVEMEKVEHKSRCQRFQRSICNAFERVLGVPAEVHVILASLSLAPPAAEEDAYGYDGSSGRRSTVAADHMLQAVVDMRREQQLHKGDVDGCRRHGSEKSSHYTRIEAADLLKPQRRQHSRSRTSRRWAMDEVDRSGNSPAAAACAERRRGTLKKSTTMPDDDGWNRMMTTDGRMRSSPAASSDTHVFDQQHHHGHFSSIGSVQMHEGRSFSRASINYASDVPAARTSAQKKRSSRWRQAAGSLARSIFFFKNVMGRPVS